MIRAIFFDFNGVLVDDEPLHLRLFQKILKEEGIHLTQEAYYQKYLGMDDFDCFKSAAQDAQHPFSEEKIQELIQRKTGFYQEEVQKGEFFLPGVLEFIRQLASTHFLAVVSGALRQEIEMLLQHGKVLDLINVIVAAGEIQHGKPDPEGYDKAMRLLNRDFVASSEFLLPVECLVVEDSVWGIEAAKAAGMPCLAITTSFPEKSLPGALAYLKNFKGVNPGELLKKIEEKVT